MRPRRSQTTQRGSARPPHCASPSNSIGTARSRWIDGGGGRIARKISSGPCVRSIRVRLLDGMSVTVYRSIWVSPAVARGRAHRRRHRIARHPEVSLSSNFFETHIRHNSSPRRLPPRHVRALVGPVILPPLLACLVLGVRRPACPRRAQEAALLSAVLLAAEISPANVEPAPAPAAAQLVKTEVGVWIHPFARTDRNWTAPTTRSKVPEPSA
jgi:hypothetical protein